MGLLTTDLKYDAIRTEFQTSTQIDPDRLTNDFNRMKAELSSLFEKGGLKGHDVTYTRSGDLRYIGQGYELRVPFADGPIDDPILAEVFQAFETIHAREYGHVFEESPIEIVNIRLTGSRQMAKNNIRQCEP